MRPGQARELLRGAIDMHVHTHPALFPRPHDDVDVARMARDLGMRAIRAAGMEAVDVRELLMKET